MKGAFIGFGKVTLERLEKSAHYSLMLLFLSLSATNARAESTNVKIMMDWVIGSTHAPFFIAQDKGYYRANGVTVDSIDAGRGATNVAVRSLIPAPRSVNRALSFRDWCCSDTKAGEAPAAAATTVMLAKPFSSALVRIL